MEKNNPFTHPKISASISLDKLKKANSLAMKKNSVPSNAFPSINHSQSSTNTKAMMTLSKVDMLPLEPALDKMRVNRSQSLNSSQQKWGSVQLQKSLNKYIENKKESATKVSKTLYFMKKFEKEKFASTNTFTKNQNKDEESDRDSKSKAGLQNSAKKLENLYQRQFEQRPSELHDIFGSTIRYADKKAGIIRGYAVSSQIGTLCPINNLRMTIAINILKTSNPNKELSFFGLFEGKNGLGRAEFMRQNFHQALANDEFIFYNFEKSVSRVFDKIDREFTYDPKFQGDYSSVEMTGCVIIGKSMYFIRCGNPNATISDNLGRYIKSFTIPLKKKQSNRNLLGSGKYEINIRSFELDNQFDFFLLGSEGLYDVFNPGGEIGRIFWKMCLEEDSLSRVAMLERKNNQNSKVQFNSTLSKFSVIKPESTLTNSNNNNNNTNSHKNQINNNKVSEKLAKVCHKMCWKAVKADQRGRCISALVVAFKNIQDCLEEHHLSEQNKEEIKLEIPYTNLKEENNSLLKKKREKIFFMDQPEFEAIIKEEDDDGEKQLMNSQRE